MGEHLAPGWNAHKHMYVAQLQLYFVLQICGCVWLTPSGRGMRLNTILAMSTSAVLAQL
jgi:hypothetical protein